MFWIKAIVTSFEVFAMPQNLSETAQKLITNDENMMFLKPKCRHNIWPSNHDQSLRSQCCTARYSDLSDWGPQFLVLVGGARHKFRRETRSLVPLSLHLSAVWCHFLAYTSSSCIKTALYGGEGVNGKRGMGRDEWEGGEGGKRKLYLINNKETSILPQNAPNSAQRSVSARIRCESLLSASPDHVATVVGQEWKHSHTLNGRS